MLVHTERLIFGHHAPIITYSYTGSITAQKWKQSLLLPDNGELSSSINFHLQVLNVIIPVANHFLFFKALFSKISKLLGSCKIILLHTCHCSCLMCNFTIHTIYLAKNHMPEHHNCTSFYGKASCHWNWILWTHWCPVCSLSDTLFYTVCSLGDTALQCIHLSLRIHAQSHCALLEAYLGPACPLFWTMNFQHSQSTWWLHLWWQD